MKLLNGFDPNGINPDEVPATHIGKHKNHSESLGPLLSPDVTQFAGASPGSPTKLIDRNAPIKKSEWDLGKNGPRLSVPDEEEERPIVKLNKK